jgi:hypothetical protein
VDGAPERVSPLPQTPTRPHRLHNTQSEPDLDIGATLTRASAPAYADRAATQGGGNEHAQPERRARDSGPDLPGRSPAGLLSYTRPGALDATQPIFLAAVAFGLATDYGIFLLSRIKEARDSGVSDSEAVAVELERTGRIVTAAAVLFAVAIGAFATSKLVFIKQLGLGVALAVLIDATIIRALLVPSLMELLGSRNWWAPKPLRRLHNRIGLRENEPGNADTAPVPSLAEGRP